jgi:hypothetical protein
MHFKVGKKYSVNIGVDAHMHSQPSDDDPMVENVPSYKVGS